MNVMRLMAAVCVAAIVVGCGQKGPLVLPDAPKHKKVMAKPHPAATTAPAPTPAPAASGDAAPSTPASGGAQPADAPGNPTDPAPKP